MSTPEANEGRSFDPQQVWVIQAAQKLADVLVEKHPRIANDYRAGSTQLKIIEDHKLTELCDSVSVCRSAVSRALGLLIDDKAESERIARDHRNRGIQAIPSEVHRNNGLNARNAKKGLFAMNLQEKKEAARWAVAGRGYIPWEGWSSEIETGMDELTYLSMLLENPRFRHQGKHARYTTDWPSIVNKLNEIFHRGRPVRTVDSVQTARRLRLK